MTLRLRDRSLTPPSGYRDIAPETGFPFVADSLEQLIQKEAAHLRANKLPVPSDLAAAVENRLCHRMPNGICESTDGEKYQGGAAKKGSTHILNATMGIVGGRVVSQDVAERRAATCAQCQHNARNNDCATCHGVTASIRGMLGGRSTASDYRLHVCTITGTYNVVSVHQFDVGKLVRDGLWEKCWIRKGK
jgi:hypothetical protein